MVDSPLRPARSSDYHAVRDLLEEARLPTEGLEEHFADGYVVAEHGGAVIGAEGIEVYGRYGLLRSAVVDAEHRGTGLGEKLTMDRLAWARQNNLKALYLLTTTAAPFFKRIGFETVDRASAPAELQVSKEFASVCPSSAVCMKMDL